MMGAAPDVATYIKYIDAAFIHKEAFKQCLGAPCVSNTDFSRRGAANGRNYLDNNETLAEYKNDGINPGTPTLPDGKNRELGEEGESEQHDVDKRRYDGQGKDTAHHQGMELSSAGEVPYPPERIRGCDGRPPEVRGRPVDGLQQFSDPGRRSRALDRG